MDLYYGQMVEFEMVSFCKLDIFCVMINIFILTSMYLIKSLTSILLNAYFTLLTPIKKY